MKTRSLRGFSRVSELIAISAIAAFVVLYKLGTPAVYWWDEGRVAINAREMMTAANPLVTTINGEPDLWNTKPPLSVWLSALSMAIFGVNEWALRLPSGLAAVGTVVATYLFTRRKANRTTAVLAALMLLGTGGFIEVHVARTADYDSLLVLWLTLTTFSLYTALDNGKFHVPAIFFALALLTKGPAALLMVPGYAAYVAISGRLKTLWRPAVAWGAAAFAPLLLFLFARELAEPGYLVASWEWDAARLGTEVERHGGPWYFYLTGLIWPWQVTLTVPWHEVAWIRSAFPWSFLALTMLAKPPGPARYLLICLGGFLVAVSIAATKHPWYHAPAYPLIAVLGAMGTARVRAAIGAAFVLAAACVTANVWKIEKELATTGRSVEQRLPNFARSRPGKVVRDFEWTVQGKRYEGPVQFYGRHVVDSGYVPEPGETVIGCGETKLRVLERQGSCFVAQ